MANLEKIVDELSSLTVLEAAELAKLLETKWGVSAAAAVAVAAAPGAAVTVQLRPAHADDGALVLSICDRGGGAAPGHGGSRPHRLDRPDAASNGSSQPSGPALAEGLADSGGGYGLTGMRERAALLGGSLTAGPAADGWLVELRLPAGACEDAAGPRPAGGS